MSASISLADIAPGFSAPVADAQATFRALMNAFAYPARARPAPVSLAPVGALNPVAAAALLTLADADTPLWLDEDLRADPAVPALVAFHCAAPLVEDVAAARIAVASAPAKLPPLAAFAQGSAEYPDRSATIILQVREMSAVGGIFSGPGLRAPAAFDFTPKPADFAAQWLANNAAFPLGVDLVLASANELAALPRSTILRER